MRAFAAALALGTVAHATKLYLSPPSSLAACHVLPGYANTLLSHHLALDFFESIEDGLDSPQLSLPFAGTGNGFVGQGTTDGLLLSLDDSHAKDILPVSLGAPFTVAKRHPSSPSFPVSSILSKYADRAQYAYTYVYTPDSAVAVPAPRTLDLFAISPSDATAAFLSDLAALTDLLESDSDSSKFGVFDLGARLHAIAKEHGRNSEHYALAASAAGAVISSALAKSTATPSALNLAVITYPSTHNPHSKAKSNALPNTHARRAAHAQPPQSPLPPNVPNAPDGSSTLSSCFSSVEACSNATNTCSGHGSCVASGLAGSCFACACSVTLDTKGRREWWAGEACERVDVSGPFVLLAGTGIATILLIVGSISLLYSIGTEELPSVLTSTAAPRG